MDKITNKYGIAVHEEVITDQTSATAQFLGLIETVTFNKEDDFFYDLEFETPGMDISSRFSYVLRESNTRIFIISGVVKADNKPAWNIPIQISEYKGKLHDVKEVVTDKNGVFSFEVEVPYMNRPYMYQLAFAQYSGGYEWRNKLVSKKWKVPFVLLPIEDQSYYADRQTGGGNNIRGLIGLFDCYGISTKESPSSIEDYIVFATSSFNWKRQGVNADNTTCKSVHGDIWLSHFLDSYHYVTVTLEAPCRISVHAEKPSSLYSDDDHVSEYSGDNKISFTLVYDPSIVKNGLHLYLDLDMPLIEEEFQVKMTIDYNDYTHTSESEFFKMER